MVHGGTKRHPEELRTLAIRRFRSCQNVAQLAREIGIPRQTLYRWTDESERVEAREAGRLMPVENARESRHRKRIALLKDALADKTLEVDFFKSDLQTAKARRRKNSAGDELAFTTTSGT